MSSSPTAVASRIPLVQVFAAVPDPRKPRGLRHALPVVLACAAAAVLAGARTWVAVAEWTHDADRDMLSQLGIDAATRLPTESTFRRALAGIDADDFDQRLAVWAATAVSDVAGRTVIAVDGKSLRGADDGVRMPHLLAAIDHASGIVVGQRAVADKSSEIPALRDLLATFDLTDVVVTADALHCQRQTATFITEAGGHYALTIKANQPRLLTAVKKLPWTDVPAHRHRDHGHGRRVTRTVQAVTAPPWIDFPGAAQVLKIRRTRTIKGHKRTEVVFIICSVPMTTAPPPVVAGWVRGHWSIENALHWVRDVVFDEDHHQLRVGSGPQVMASLRNLAISLLRLTGWRTIAAGLRHHSRNSTRPIQLLATT
jgi:predicted transposase YbfD/YdcC